MQVQHSRRALMAGCFPKAPATRTRASVVCAHARPGSTVHRCAAYKATAPIPDRELGAAGAVEPLSPSVLQAVKPLPVQAPPPLPVSVADIADTIQGGWEDSKDKVSLVALGAVSLVFLSLGVTITNVVEAIPFAGGAMELVGIGATAWFTYKYLAFGPDRAALVRKVLEFTRAVFGK